MNGDMTAKMIRQAVCRPDDRMRFLSQGMSEMSTNTASSGKTSIVRVLQEDETAKAFGLDKISSQVRTFFFLPFFFFLFLWLTIICIFMYFFFNFFND